MDRDRRYAWAASALVAVIGLTTCGGDDGHDRADDGHDRADYVEVLDEAAPSLSAEDAECGAEAIVDHVGVDVLEDAAAWDKIQNHPEGSLEDWGVQLSDEQVDDLGAGLTECIDRSAFRDVLTSEGDLSPELAECVMDGVDDSSYARLLGLTLARGEDAVDSEPELSGIFEEAATDCAARGVS